MREFNQERFTAAKVELLVDRLKQSIPGFNKFVDFDRLEADNQRDQYLCADSTEYESDGVITPTCN